MKAAYLMIILDETERKATKPGKKGTMRGLMEPILEGIWDRMLKEERHIRRQ